MGKTSAERQAAYRQRHLKDETGRGERLNLIVSVHAKAALERLASYHGMSQRDMLAHLLQRAEGDLVDTLPAADAGLYYAGTLSLRVTP